MKVKFDKIVDDIPPKTTEKVTLHKDINPILRLLIAWKIFKRSREWIEEKGT